MAVVLDEIDLQLLSELQADADRTNVELSRMVGLSPAATLNRVRRLKASGVIKVISARLDAAALGFPLQMYVAATLGRHDPRATRVFEDQIRAIPQIIAADNVTGEMDYLLTIVARNVTELQQVLAALVSARQPATGDLPAPGGGQAAVAAATAAGHADLRLSQAAHRDRTQRRLGKRALLSADGLRRLPAGRRSSMSPAADLRGASPAAPAPPA